jgi:hypothetical protein
MAVLNFLLCLLGCAMLQLPFCTLMNDVFRPFLDKSVVVYLDDIVVFSENMEDHKRHLAEVFEALRQEPIVLEEVQVCLWADQNSILGPLDWTRMHPHGSCEDKGN